MAEIVDSEPFFPRVSTAEMCEIVSEFFRETRGIDVTPEQVWGYSPTGELSRVFEWYQQAVVWRKTTEVRDEVAEEFERRAASIPRDSPEFDRLLGELERETEARVKAVVARAIKAMRHG